MMYSFNIKIMNENLNLVEILKDCPKGTKLYSTVLGEVNFMGIKENATYPIIVKINDENFESFTADGRMIVYIDGECTLFPSKEQRDWTKFKIKNSKKEELVSPCEFKNGDILATNTGLQVFILQRAESDKKGYCYIGYDFKLNVLFLAGKWRFDRLATEEEKQKLFDAIKLNGYKWNAETKTLEKLVEPKFDPKTLQPFDKVLVRRGSENSDVWFPDFVSSPPDDENNKTLCMCIMEDIAMVIPYNDDTKHLVGTSDEAPEFYRYWED